MACPWMALSGDLASALDGACHCGRPPAEARRPGGWLGGCQGVAGSAGASANVGGLAGRSRGDSSRHRGTCLAKLGVGRRRGRWRLCALPQRPAPPARPAPSRPLRRGFPRRWRPRTAPGRAPCAPSALSAFPGLRMCLARPFGRLHRAGGAGWALMRPQARPPRRRPVPRTGRGPEVPPRERHPKVAARPDRAARRSPRFEAGTCKPVCPALPARGGALAGQGNRREARLGRRGVHTLRRSAAFLLGDGGRIGRLPAAVARGGRGGHSLTLLGSPIRGPRRPIGGGKARPRRPVNRAAGGNSGAGDAGSEGGCLHLVTGVLSRWTLASRSRLPVLYRTWGIHGSSSENCRE